MLSLGPFVMGEGINPVCVQVIPYSLLSGNVRNVLLVFPPVTELSFYLDLPNFLIFFFLNYPLNVKRYAALFLIFNPSLQE